MLDSDDRFGEGKYRDRPHTDLFDGAVAGLPGGLSIMVLCLGTDAVYFKPLATPDVLAETLIGRESRLDVTMQLRIIRLLMFTVLHLAAFTGIGIFFTVLLRTTRARNTLLIGGLYGLSACTTLFLAVLDLSGTGLSAVPQWPSVFLWNFVAGVVMAGYLKVRATREA